MLKSLEKIASQKTTFMGQTVPRFSTPFEIRKELRRMAEAQEISPKEFWAASKKTWEQMELSEGWMAAEYEELS